MSLANMAIDLSIKHSSSSESSTSENAVNILPHINEQQQQHQQSSDEESSSDKEMNFFPYLHQKQTNATYINKDASGEIGKSNEALHFMAQHEEQHSLSENSLLENAMKILPYIHQQQSTAYLKPRWSVTNINDKKIYACSHEGCKSVFDRPHRLQQHQHLHMNIRPFKCPEEKCMKSYTSKSHLDRHIKCVHKMKTDCDTVIYSCPACMKTYVNRQNLKRHIFKEHINTLNAFFCDVCNKKFKNKNQLTAHMYQHTGVKAYKCDYCPLDFVSLYEKKKHTRNHKTYECDVCAEKFYRWSLYLKHKRTDHVSDEYICHDCGKVFKKRLHILQHVKIHSTDLSRSFQCPFENCTRSYSRNSNLTQHIKVKHEKISFTCTMCGAILCSKATLQKHIINMHSGKEKKKRTPKTLETGRKVRKDKNVIKKISALKLAGLQTEPESKLNVEPGGTAFQLVKVKTEPGLTPDPLDTKESFPTDTEESFPIDHEIFPTKYFHV